MGRDDEITIGEAARLTGVSTASIYQAVKRGRLDAKRVPRKRAPRLRKPRIRVRRADVMRLWPPSKCDRGPDTAIAGSAEQTEAP